MTAVYSKQPLKVKIGFLPRRLITKPKTCNSLADRIIFPYPSCREEVDEGTTLPAQAAALAAIHRIFVPRYPGQARDTRIEALAGSVIPKTCQLLA